MSQDLLTAIDGAVARITFNRPQARNAVNSGMLAVMHQFPAEHRARSAVRCIVIGGAVTTSWPAAT
jgi:enoyl-CoA hydratase/carnithine racemase